jgi:ribokinase
MFNQNKLKQMAAKKAVELVEEGMVLGIGTGSTVDFFIDFLAEKIQHQKLKITAVTTSSRTTKRALQNGIDIKTIDDVDHIDLNIDGADEIDPYLNGIKGGGAALLWEKIIARDSKKVVWIADESKVVGTLGKFPLPIEVRTYGVGRLIEKLSQASLEPKLRMGDDGNPLLTDSNNYIIDLGLGRIPDPYAMAKFLEKQDGVIDHGLFLDIASQAIVGTQKGIQIIDGSERQKLMNKQNKKIVVLGSLNVDSIQHLDALPLQGQTTPIKELSSAPGGKGANQAVSAARQGANVSFIGGIGNDVNGQFMKSTLEANGVNTDFIGTKNVPTGAAYIMLEDDGHNTILIFGGANQEVSVEDVKKAEQILVDADVVITQFETPQESAIAAFEIAKANGAMTILNPAPGKFIEEKLIELSDFVVPNETEAEIITGVLIDWEKENYKEIADQMTANGIKNSIITLGERGLYYKVGEQEGLLPSYKVNAVDTTAAGDTFIGAFAANLAEDFSNLEESLKWASRASSLAVQKKGAMPSIPTFEEVSQNLDD